MNAKLIPSNEIIANLLCHRMSREQADAALHGEFDAKAFLMSEKNIDLPDDFDVNFVKNDDKTVNIVLPCYENLSRSNVGLIEDDELEAVAGGEVVIISCLIVIGGALGITGIITGLAVSDAQSNK